MSENKRIKPLLEWFEGRSALYGGMPERVTVYPLPVWSPVKADGSYKRSARTSAGEIAIFEFGFPALELGAVPWEDLDESLPHHCKTCEWDFMRGKGTSYCRSQEEVCEGSCTEWEISPDEIGTAMVEYYKQLHESSYGPCGVVVSLSGKQIGR